VQFPPETPVPGRPNLIIASANRGTSLQAAQPAPSPFVPAPPPAEPVKKDNATVVVEAARMPPPGLIIHCRHGEPSRCNLDERDAQGRTAIAGYAAELKVDEVQLLLANGAHPSAPAGTGGIDAFDLVLSRLRMRTPAEGSIDGANALRILEAMAAAPGATLRAELRKDLDTPEAQWVPMSPQARTLMLEARARLASLPARRSPPRARPSKPRRATRRCRWCPRDASASRERGQLAQQH
jgi:hypothetical protein